MRSSSINWLLQQKKICNCVLLSHKIAQATKTLRASDWNKAPPHAENREKNETKWPRLSSCSHRHPRHHFLKEGSSHTTQTTMAYKEGEESSLLLEYLKVKCEKALMTNLLVIHTCFLPAWPILFVMTYMVNEQKHVQCLYI